MMSRRRDEIQLVEISESTTTTTGTNWIRFEQAERHLNTCTDPGHLQVSRLHDVQLSICSCVIYQFCIDY